MLGDFILGFFYPFIVLAFLRLCKGREYQGPTVTGDGGCPGIPKAGPTAGGAAPTP